MRWLVQRVLTIWLLLIGGTSVAVILGRQLPLPVRVAAMHLADCKLPCWNGIVPGTTMIDEARKHLEASYGQSSAYQINSHLGYLEVIFLKAANAKAHIKVTIGEGRIVDGIIFGFFEDQPTTAEIYTLLGPPTLFSRADSGSTNPGYALVYGSQKWRVTFNGWLASDLSCKDEIDVVTFSTYGLTNEVLSDADNSWPGFYKFAKRLGCLPS